VVVAGLRGEVIHGELAGRRAGQHLAESPREVGARRRGASVDCLRLGERSPKWENIRRRLTDEYTLALRLSRKNTLGIKFAENSPCLRFARRSRLGLKVRGFGKPENAKRAAQRGAVSIRCSTLCLAAETRLNGSVLLHCAHNENPTSTLVASRYYASIIGIRDEARRFAVLCFYYWYSRRSSSLRGTMLLLLVFATKLVASRYHASIIRDDARRFAVPCFYYSRRRSSL
jgi:hypothetical protein